MESNPDWKNGAKNMAAGIRRRVLEHTIKKNGGYLSQACSAGDIFAALYSKILNIGPVETPIMPGKFEGTPNQSRAALTGAGYNGGKSPEYDRFILSPAQYALVLYATLIEAGRMDDKGMSEYNKDCGIVEMIGAEHSPGMEVTTGSLGQGISQAAGIAMARKMRGDTGRVVVFMSDGECQAGQFWEAVQAMSFHRLSNMLVYVDMNGCQCDGEMVNVMNIEPFDKRLEAFGAHVFRIDGHNLDALYNCSRQKVTDKPVFVLCDTDPCRGLPILSERRPKFHYVRFKNADERARYKSYYKKLT